MSEIRKHQADNILKSFEDEGALALRNQEVYDICKGRKAEVIGTKKTYGDKEYIKTANGWKPVGKKSGAAKQAADFVHGESNKEAIDKIVKMQMDTYKDKVKIDPSVHDSMVKTLKVFIKDAKEDSNKGITIGDITLNNKDYIKAMETVLSKIENYKK